MVFVFHPIRNTDFNTQKYYVTCYSLNLFLLIVFGCQSKCYLLNPFTITLVGVGVNVTIRDKTITTDYHTVHK